MPVIPKHLGDVVESRPDRQQNINLAVMRGFFFLCTLYMLFTQSWEIVIIEDLQNI